MKHPMQAIVLKDGIARFQDNAIIQHLFETGAIDLNKLALGGFSKDDHMQLAQLLGYSVSGFGDQPYADPLVVRVADEIVTKIIHTEKTMAEPNSPREAVAQHKAGESRFKIGDVVVLKSGGPGMAVFQFRADGLVETCWFDGAVLMRDAFADIELDLAPQQPPPPPAYDPGL